MNTNGRLQKTRKEEAQELLENGSWPSEIASQMGVEVEAVIQDLRTRVGDGALRFSDIYFAFSPQQRKILGEVVKKRERLDGPDLELLNRAGLSIEELDLFSSLRTQNIFAGDMYEHLAYIEVTLHKGIQNKLKAKFGNDDKEWWRRGIPERIRVNCMKAHEEVDDDDEYAKLHAYARTHLIDLSTIVSENWDDLKELVPSKYWNNARHFRTAMGELNRIRNAVMHPVKRCKWYEKEFQFVSEFRAALPKSSTA